MGFLIYAYRKLFLKSKLNDLTFKSMLLSMKQQQVTTQIGNLQEAMSNTKNMISVFTNNALANLNQNMMASGQNQDGSVNQNALSMQNMGGFNSAQYQVMAQANACNSVFESTQKAQLSQLAALDKQIEMQKTSLDQQTKQLNYELDSVDKAENDAAKKDAPTFGLS